MKKKSMQSGRVILVITLLLFTVLIGKSQVLNIRDFAIFGGDLNCPTGPGQTAPSGPNPCRVNISTGAVINGNVGSYSFVQCQGASTVNGNIHSGGKINFQNSVYCYGVSAANRFSETGDIFFTGNAAEINGNVNINGNVSVNPNAGSYITGYLRHPSGSTYSGPVPVGGEIVGAPNLPVLPSLPDTLSFSCSGGPNITGTQTITPGSYGSIILGNSPATITFSGPGNYFFNTIQMQQGGIHRFIYDMKDLPGSVKIYVCGDVKLGDFVGGFVNPEDANPCRVYIETHGRGATNGNEFSFMLEPSSTFQGIVWAPYAGIKIGAGSGVVNIYGNLYSSTVVDIGAGVTVTPCSECDQTITITKVVDGSAPSSSWAFTSNIPGHTSFTIPPAGGSKTFSGVPIGTYTVTELSKDIPGSSPARQYTVTNTCGTGNVASITVGSCEYKTCVFNNKCVSKLTVTKVFNSTNPLLIPSTNWQFTISPTLDGKSSFTLPPAGGSQVFNNVPIGGTYTVAEAAKIDPTCLDYSNFIVSNSYGSGNSVVINILGCPDTGFSFINTPPPCTRCSLQVSVNSPSRCSNGAGATITATAIPSGSYTYSWTVPSGASNPGNVASFTATVAGNYSVTVNDGRFCNVSASGTLTVNPLPTVVCIGNNLNQTLTANPSGGTAPYTYSWNTVPIKTTQTISVADGNTYTVTVTDAKGCSGSSSCSVNSCNGFTTYTQGGYGAQPKGGNPAQFLKRNFAAAFPGPDCLTIGCPTGNKLRLTTSKAVLDFLPSGSTPSALPAGLLINPGSNYSNVFAGQLTTATINVKFDLVFPSFSPSSINLKDLIVNSGLFAGWTVAQVITEANNLIGGCPSIYSYSQMTDILDAINKNYDSSRYNYGILSCPGTFPLAFASRGVASADAPEVIKDVMVFPNPFQQSVKIRFRAEENVRGKLEIFNMTGLRIAVLLDQNLRAGEYYISTFDYPQLSGGIYMYRLRMGNKVINGKLVKAN